MRANELRIGNYIQVDTGGEFMITKVRIRSVVSIMLGESNVEPIPLTEEWLLKFGFEKVEYDSEQSGYGVEYVLDIIGVEGFRLEYQDDFSISIMYSQNDLGITPHIDRFKHVHQLQNLYFALTGEELTLKEI